MGLFDIFQGGGGVDPATGMPAGGISGGLLDPANAPMLGLAQGLLSASGASRLPVTLGAALGAGVAGAQDMQTKAIQNRLSLYNLQRQKLMMGMLQGAMSGGQSPATAAMGEGAQEQPNQTLPAGTPQPAPAGASFGPISGGGDTQMGGVGPTTGNAARMDSLPPGGTNPNLPPGMTPQSMAMAFIDPQLAAMYAPTPEMKNAAAAFGNGSPAYIRAIRAQAQKAGFIPPTAGRPGGTILFNDGSGRVMSLPGTPEPGFVNNFDPTTGRFNAEEIGGGLNAVARSGYAEAIPKDVAKAQTSPTQTFSNGVPYTSLNPFGISPSMFGFGPPGANGRTVAPAAGGGASGATAQSGATVPRGSVQSGPGLGEETGANASAKQYTSDQVAAGGFAGRMFTLQKSLESLQNAHTGPGTEDVNNAKSFLLAQSPDWLKDHLPGVDPQKIKSWDEAQKYLTQYALAQTASLGEGTDAKLATVLTGNANTHISSLAAQDVVRSNMALERMNQAVLNEATKQGVPGRDYTKWRSTFVSNLDPRVFAWDTMDPAAKQRAAAQMTPKERDGFTQKYNWALQGGYIPGAQQ